MKLNKQNKEQLEYEVDIEELDTNAVVHQHALDSQGNIANKEKLQMKAKHNRLY